LADALDLMRQEKDIYGCRVQGVRFDTGDKFGLVQAVIHFALKNPSIQEKVRAYLQSIQ